ncbi:polyketide synthase dehydratase domain-containing protein, partial [Streptomyces sp. NPDC004011]
LPVLRDRAGAYADYTAAGFGYGPSFQVIDEIRAGSGEALVRLDAGAGGPATEVPPALLDGALRACHWAGRTTAPRAGELAVPFSLGALDVRAPLPPVCLAHARRTGEAAGAGRFDLTVYDERGRVLAELRDFAGRPPTPATASASVAASAAASASAPASASIAASASAAASGAATVPASASVPASVSATTYTPASASSVPGSVSAPATVTVPGTTGPQASGAAVPTGGAAVLYEPYWQDAGEPAQGSAADTLAVLGRHPELEAALAATGVWRRVVNVPEDPGALADALAGLAHPDGLDLAVAGGLTAPAPAPDAGDPAGLLDRVCGTVLQVLGAARSDELPGRVRLLVLHSQDGGHDRPEWAALAGFARSTAPTAPRLELLTLGVDPALAADAAAEAVVADLRAAPRAAGLEARRTANGARQVRALRPVHPCGGPNRRCATAASTSSPAAAGPSAASSPSTWPAPTGHGWC